MALGECAGPLEAAARHLPVWWALEMSVAFSWSAV